MAKRKKVTKKKHSVLFILSSPSGGGKTTVRKVLVKKDRKLVYIVSHTSRPKRPKEQNRRDYVFIKKNVFQRAIRNEAFLEWALVHGHYYGTPKRELVRRLARGQDCLLDIDTEGFMKIKKLSLPCVSIFILPPSRSVLAQRLTERKTDTKDVIRKRLKNAEKEVKCSSLYNYVVINRTVAQTVRTIEQIIFTERLKYKKKDLIYGYVSSRKIS